MRRHEPQSAFQLGPPSQAGEEASETATAAQSLLAALALPSEHASYKRGGLCSSRPVQDQSCANADISGALSHGAAHTEAGDEIVATSSADIIAPELGAPLEHVQSDTSQLQRSLGIVHDATACAQWGITSQDVGSCTETHAILARACHAIRHCVAGVAAARIAAVCLQHAGWCRAALATVGTALTDLREALKQIRSRQRKHVPVDCSCLGRPASTADVQSAISRSLKMALAAVQDPFESCLEMLEDCDGSENDSIDAETVVYVLANLDSVYYVLLDLHLSSGMAPLVMPHLDGDLMAGRPARCMCKPDVYTCMHGAALCLHCTSSLAAESADAAGWQVPSVPPPHAYFPAMVQLLQPEVDDAVAQLFAKAGAERSAAFRRVWDLSDGMSLPGADPLRQVRLHVAHHCTCTLDTDGIPHAACCAQLGACAHMSHIHMVGRSLRRTSWNAVGDACSLAGRRRALVCTRAGRRWRDGLGRRGAGRLGSLVRVANARAHRQRRRRCHRAWRHRSDRIVRNKRCTRG